VVPAHRPGQPRGGAVAAQQQQRGGAHIGRGATGAQVQQQQIQQQQYETELSDEQRSEITESVSFPEGLFFSSLVVFCGRKTLELMLGD
jgi:hypothetical protein